MMKIILISMIILALTACKEKFQDSEHKTNTEKSKISPYGIDFNFSAEQMRDQPQMLKIKGNIFNGKKDTVYFLSTSCDGEQYSLVFDSLNWTLKPKILCNISALKTITIAPKENHSFAAHLYNVNDKKNIQLGFDFFEVGKTFDSRNAKNLKLKVFHRKIEDQNIIWAKETTIK